MPRLSHLLAILLLIAGTGAAVFLMTWDIPPPTATVEKIIPDDRFPK